MAKMIVQAEGTFRRPASRLSFTFKPGLDPQSWPEDVVAYAVSKGKAIRVEPQKRGKATPRVGVNGA